MQPFGECSGQLLDQWSDSVIERSDFRDARTLDRPPLCRKCRPEPLEMKEYFSSRCPNASHARSREHQRPHDGGLGAREEQLRRGRKKSRADEIRDRIVEACRRLLRVADDGCGMTLGEGEKQLASHRLLIKADDEDRRDASPAFGEKGIGRLSADRQGESRDARDRRGAEPVVLRVAWDRFDAPGTDLNKVPVVASGTPPTVPTEDNSAPAPSSRNKVLISGLRLGGGRHRCHGSLRRAGDLDSARLALRPISVFDWDRICRGAPSGEVRCIDERHRRGSSHD